MTSDPVRGQLLVHAGQHDECEVVAEIAEPIAQFAPKPEGAGLVGQFIPFSAPPMDWR
jgi:hypothetical protein